MENWIKKSKFIILKNIFLIWNKKKTEIFFRSKYKKFDNFCIHFFLILTINLKNWNDPVPISAKTVLQRQGLRRLFSLGGPHDAARYTKPLSISRKPRTLLPLPDSKRGGRPAALAQFPSGPVVAAAAPREARGQVPCHQHLREHPPQWLHGRHQRSRCRYWPNHAATGTGSVCHYPLPSDGQRCRGGAISPRALPHATPPPSAHGGWHAPESEQRLQRPLLLRMTWVPGPRGSHSTVADLFRVPGPAHLLLLVLRSAETLTFSARSIRWTRPKIHPSLHFCQRLLLSFVLLCGSENQTADDSLCQRNKDPLIL